MPDGITEAEIETVTQILSKLQPGRLPFTIFHEFARLGVLPIVEVVPLRLSPAGQIEILLLERDADDPVWPGQLHVPGTVVQASDTEISYSNAFSRIFQGELQLAAAPNPVFVQNILHHSGRGMESSQIYWAEITGTPKAGRFYDTEQLPENLVQSQLDFIPQAIAAFNQAKSNL